MHHPTPTRIFNLAALCAVALVASACGAQAQIANSTEAQRSQTMTDSSNTTPSAAADPSTSGTQLASAVFAGGCFWCVEAVFEQIDGVHEVISGYAGGASDTANYSAVSSGRTRHAEAVKITYDPAKVSYEQLLEIHFKTHDPTTLNRQGNDVGTQYRSTIFYADENEKQMAQAFIDKLNASGHYPNPVVTTLEPLDEFYPAEAYHQDYVCHNPNNGYVQAVSLPKIEKTRKLFKDMLKPKEEISKWLP